MRRLARLLSPIFLTLAILLFGPTGLTTAQAATRVAFDEVATAKTIIVKTSERKLYLVMGDGTALRYDVGVGRPARQWAGHSSITGKYIRPNWAPPLQVKRDKPGLPDIILSGAPGNPMGAAAMTLAGGEYAIHGTNTPSSIGGFVSYGCIRMFNSDILDLYTRVEVGTTVIVN
jgi:lipoprotein-anchoring transpeptidase ErfK/SrfK